jgi:NitT/TauT family transport system permease protein
MQADSLPAAPALGPPDFRRLWVRGAQAALLAGILLGWQLASADETWNAAISSPTQVARRLASWFVDPTWWPHAWATVEEAALGYLLGLALALLLIAIVAPSRTLGDFLSPFIAGVHSLPKVALAPLFIFWFGTTLQSKVYFVASLICFIIFYGIQVGLRTIDSGLRDNVRLLGASPREMLLHLYFPAILTWIIASLRMSTAFALLAAVIGEYLGSNRGLGYLIARGQQSMQADAVIAGILLVATICVLLDRALIATERRMSAWRAF